MLQLVARLIRSDLVILVVGIPAGLTIYLSIFIAVFAVEGAMIPFPFHFPLDVFEFPHRHPGFVAAR